MTMAKLASARIVQSILVDLINKTSCDTRLNETQQGNPKDSKQLTVDSKQLTIDSK